MPPLARACLLLGLAALLISFSWRRLEQVAAGWGEILPLLAIALLPVLVAAFVRPRLSAGRARLAVGLALLGSALLVGVGWPATLNPGENALRAGALALVGVLAVLFLLRGVGRPARGLPQAAAIGVLLVAVAVVASGSPAVAKSAFLSWQNWDPYDRPDDPVSVNYVWSANYDGISFPEKATTVLRVKVSGQRRSLYWRGGTLDGYTGNAWGGGGAVGAARARRG